jgi:hypothetical protein
MCPSLEFVEMSEEKKVLSFRVLPSAAVSTTSNLRGMKKKRILHKCDVFTK